MAQSQEKISPEIAAEVERQYQANQVPDDVKDKVEEIYQIRQGIYPNDTVYGLAQTAIGTIENIGQMVTGFMGAAPAAIGGGVSAGVAELDSRDETTAGGAYTAVFEDVAGKLTYNPRTKKGKKYNEALHGAYNKWINEKWGEHVGELVDQGYVSPETATWMRVSADALLLGLPIKAGQTLRGFKSGRRGTRPNDPDVDIDAVEGQIIPKDGGSGRVDGRIGRVGETIDGETVPSGALEATARLAFEEAALKRLPPPLKRLPPPPTDVRANLFRNRQAGAVDPSVIAEGVRKALRPVEVGAKGAIDLSHALSRQIGFKHLTDIRKLESPTAKMLADRIMPSQSSTIPLGAGFHELISLKEGALNTKLDLTLAPLRRHVVNKNSVSSMRLVALPKKINDGIIRGLETNRAPESLAPAVKAVRSILQEALEYQREAGVKVTERPGYFPHLWDVSKIQRAEWGRGDGAFTKHLTEDLGIPKDAASDIVRSLIREDGFLDFAEDTGGRLKGGQDYSAWSRSHRVGGGPSSPPHLKHRSIETTAEKSGDWMITDLESVLNNYIRRAVLKAEYTRIAGPGEHKLNQTIRQIIEELQGSEKLKSSPHEVAQEIYDVFDAMQYRFHPIKNPAVLSANRAVSGFEVMAHLGLVSLAQLPETLVPAIKYRVATPTKAAPGVPIPLKSYAVGMASAVRDAVSSASTVLTGKRIIPKSEIRQHLEKIGVVKISALESSIARMMRTSGKLTNRFMRTVLMEAVTDMQRAITYDTVQSMIRQNARYLAKGLAQGKRKRMYEKELIELGLKPEEAVKWYRDGMPKDSAFAEKMDTALVRAADTTTIMPKAANTPRLYNDPRFQLPLLFTRFFTVFGNTVIKKVFKDMVNKDVTNVRKLAATGAIIASIATAYYTQFLRESISGYEYRDEDDPMRVVDAVDRAGWTAMFTRLYPLLVGEYRYQLGPSYVANLLGGPVGTDAAKAIESAKRAYDNGDMEPVAKWMAGMTPIANITPEIEEELADFYLEILESMD